MTGQFFAFGLGIGTRNASGTWLEVYYPQPLLTPNAGIIAALEASGYSGGNDPLELDAASMQTLATTLHSNGATEQAAIAAELATSHQPLVATTLATDAAPHSVPEGYLKLHLLSHRLVKPNGIDLTGLFGVLPNVAWTSAGAVDLAELPAHRQRARIAGEILEVLSVDKFPKMTDYVVPTGVRIADTARVRLGAYLGEGTTVMHEGFINFNAGTEGPGMIEGRISAGVFAGAGSDLGGGCSTMGTLSGGNKVVISIGAGCLIGANAGVGIPLGDRCTVEAGLYLTAGSKVALLDDRGQRVEMIKARDLASQPDLLFRRNSVTGAIECLANRSAIELNEALHVNN